MMCKIKNPAHLTLQAGGKSSAWWKPSYYVWLLQETQLQKLPLKISVSFYPSVFQFLAFGLFPLNCESSLEAASEAQLIINTNNKKSGNSLPRMSDPLCEASFSSVNKLETYLCIMTHQCMC